MKISEYFNELLFNPFLKYPFKQNFKSKLALTTLTALLVDYYLPYTTTIFGTALGSFMYFNNRFSAPNSLRKKFPFKFTKPKYLKDISWDSKLTNTMSLLCAATSTYIGYKIGKMMYKEDDVRVVSNTIYYFLFGIEGGTSFRKFIYPQIRLFLNNPKKYSKRFKSEFKQDFDSIKDASENLFKNKSALIIPDLIKENYVGSLGKMLQLSHQKNNFVEKDFLTDFHTHLFYTAILSSDLKPQYLFPASLSLPMPEEIKQHWAKETVKELSKPNSEFSLEERCQILSGIGKYFEELEHPFTEFVWKEYNGLSQQNTNLLDDFVNAGGTRGTSKVTKSEIYDYAPQDYSTIFRVSKNKELIQEEIKYGRLLYNSLKNNTLVRTPKIVSEAHLGEFYFYSVIQSWMPSITKFIKSNKLSVSQIEEIVNHSISSIDEIKKLIADKVKISKPNIFESYLSDKNILHPIDKIFDSKLAYEILSFVDEFDKEIFTDSYFDNQYISLNYFKDKKPILKIDNEPPKLVPKDTDKINTYTYNIDLIPTEILDKFIDEEKEKSIDYLAALIVVRGWSRIRGLVSTPKFNEEQLLPLLRFQKNLLDKEKNNFSPQMRSIFNNYSNNIGKIYENLDSIRSYRLSKI